MSEETKQPGGIPPKLDLRKSGMVPPPPGDEAAAAAKKKTTRIPLSQAEGEALSSASAGAIPKTIRLAPPPAASRPLAAPSTPPPPKPAPAGEAAERVKRETSRIPLEAAFAAGESAAAGAPTAGQPTAAPKTIRIKRPGQATPAVKLSRPPEAEAVEAPPAAPVNAEKSKTARVDVSAIAAEAAPPTQRKTIKIRRPEAGGAAPAPRSIAVARLEAEAIERRLEEVNAPGIAYTIVAVAAVLVACVLIYVLTAQAFPTLHLSLPGKITL